MGKYVMALDAGTTSNRCILFNEKGEMCSVAQREFRQHFPKPGWVEHDADEIWASQLGVAVEAMNMIAATAEDIAAIGITNQRETAIVWDKNTGEPVYNAIVWQDTRTNEICKELMGDEGADRWRETTGLRINSYPAGPKVRWILDNVEGAREKAEAGDLLFGTIDTWLLWNLTGGAEGDNGEDAVHATDVTNASRTLLMDLKTLEWDEDICREIGIPMSMLPDIRPSVGDFGRIRARGSLAGRPVTGILGDQQAAMFGQGCFGEGDTKNTYGTGLFMLMNTGEKPKWSDHGLISTVCYQVEGEKPVYALEGSVSMGGALVQWLRDELQMIPNAASIENKAKSVKDNGGVYIVPAFSGLFAPRWQPDARGVIVGLTRFVNRHHIARAVLEAAAYQTREVLDAMVAESDTDITTLSVDGGMTMNEFLMQFQSDILNVAVTRPNNIETTALGAAYAAGLGIGFWSNLDEVKAHITIDKKWHPKMEAEERDRLFHQWNRAVERTYGWIEDTDAEEAPKPE